MAECKERCAAGCGWLGLEQWLAGPVTKTDRLVDEQREQREQRIKALLRGEIPT